MALDLGHFEKIRAIATAPRLVAIGGVRVRSESQVTAFDPTSNKRLWGVPLPAHVFGACVLDDVVLCAAADGKVYALRATNGEVAWSVAAHPGGVSAVAKASDGKTFVTAGADGALRIWTAAKREEKAAYVLSSDPLHAVAISPDGLMVGAAGDDGVVRVVTLADGTQREMPGHEGPVRALAFTPRDGRIASGGDDGTVRLHYLQGPIEHETRGADDSGHAGGVLALAFTPSPPVDKNGEDPGDRLISGGADGKIRMWRLADRRKPRSFEADGAPVHALAMGPAPRGAGSTGSTGSLFVGGDGRTLARFTLDATSTPEDSSTTYSHGLVALQTAVSANKLPLREAAVRTLGALDEVEGRALLATLLSSDRDPVVRTLAATVIETNGRRDMLAAIRERLDDDAWTVRKAAYSALCALHAAAPLNAIRAASSARSADVRRRAIADLPTVGKGSPLARPTAMAALTDADRGVRLAALDTLVLLDEPDPAAPLRDAFATREADVRAAVIARIAAGGPQLRATLAALLVRALDDAAPDVRRLSFLVSVLGRPALAVRLLEIDEDFARAFEELVRRTAESQAPRTLPNIGPDAAAIPLSEDALVQARKTLSNGAIQHAFVASKPGSTPTNGRAPLAETDVAPLIAAAACRSVDTALAGAGALAQLGDGRALGALLQLSRDPAIGIRRGAAYALAKLEGAHATKRLAWMLDDAEADVRSAAYEALARVYAETPRALIELALRASQQDIRVRGLSLLLREAEKRSSDVLGLLEDAIEDEAANVRQEALRTLWTLRKDEPAAVIERALAARFPDVRRRAVDELAAKKKDPSAHEQLKSAIGDRDASVAGAAYDALVENAGKTYAAAHLAAVASVHATLRQRGAKGFVGAPEADVRSALVKLLEDEVSDVRVAAIEALDRLLAKDDAPLRLGLQSSHLDLRVRAAELCAARGIDALVDPMRALLLDKDLERTIAPFELSALRQRASSALATLGARQTTRLFVSLLEDKDALVREQAARGLANTARKGEEGPLLDALGHADLAVRSWAGEGLARIGDARALPVLVGTLRHSHPPIRVGAVLSFAALGPEGYGGLLQGLEDPAEEVQECVLLVIFARDLRSARHGESPDLLAAALSASRPEIRFAAARALELRHDSAAYLSHLIEVLLPPKPEKASEMKSWPDEPKRSHIVVGLAEAIAGDRPEQRYAAAQALRLRSKPREFFREAEKLAKPRLASSPWIGDNTPRRAEESDVEARDGWLRKLFADSDKPREGTPDPNLLQLAFGAYVGMVRTDAGGDEQSHRVRRDAIDRIVAQALDGHATQEIALAPLVRALGDSHHLVRKAALTGIQKVLAPDVETPLAMALASPAGDIARAALDELATGGEQARRRIAEALNSSVADVRRYAFTLLEKLSPKGSLEPLLWALSSEHTDIRLGVLDGLASAADPRVRAALGRATESEHPDVRLRAAELLASFADDRAAEVLSALLRMDDAAITRRAQSALVTLGTAAAATVLAVRAEEVSGAERAAIATALGGLSKTETAIRAIASMLKDDDAVVRNAARDAGLRMVGLDVKKRDHALAAILLEALARSKDATLRLTAAHELATAKDAGSDDVLAALLRDRDATTRMTAAASYAIRVRDKNASVDPLAAIIKAGTRDLLLSAAEGVATRGLATALAPLILFARAGELDERRRALLALGYLNDKRALAELMGVIQQSTATEEPVDPVLHRAAIEALGRIHGKLADTEGARQARDAVEDAARSSDVALAVAGARGLAHIGGDIGRSRLEMLVLPGNPRDVQIASAEALGELANVASEAALAQALDNYDNSVCEAAHKSLEKLFPNDKTRVALHALASPCADIANPAAAYLSTEGDAAELLPRLATLEDEELVTRLRFGLLRRETLPTDALVKLLGNAAPTAREGAAWLAGLHVTSDKQSDLGAALTNAATMAAERWACDDDEIRSAEATAWARALWAAGRCKAMSIAPAARAALARTDAPAEVRAEAVRTLGLLGLAEDKPRIVAAVRDPNRDVRTSAAGSLAAFSPAAIASVFSKPLPDPDAIARFAQADASTLASSAARPFALRVALAAHSTSALVALLQDASADKAARIDAALTLGRTGGPDAQAVLSVIAFDKSLDAELRKAAYRAMRRARRIDAASSARQTSTSASTDASATEVIS